MIEAHQITDDSRKPPNAINRRFTQMDADKDFIKNLTAETQSTLREEFFAQSGDDDWAKDLVFRRGMFLFVAVSRQTKTFILCALCASAVNRFGYLRL